MRLLTSIPALLSVAMSGAIAAQDLTIRPCGGSLGNVITYALSGKVNANCILVTSGRRADIPLRFLDPKETRRLGVDLDLPGLLQFARLDGQGSLSFSFTLPNLPALAGFALLHQVVSYPGANSAALDQVSDVAVVPLDLGGDFRSQLAVMSVDRLSATGIDAGNGRALIIGGAKGTILWQNAHATTELWDAATRTFSPGPVMTAARASHTQTQLADGRYLFTGGVNQSNVAQNSCEILDPKTGKFSAVAAMKSVRTMHTATLLSNGKVLVVGGITDMSSGTNALTSQLNATEIYDPKTNTWSNGPNMRTPRAAHAAVDLGNGKILIVGGLSFTNIIFFKTPNIQKSCELYDTANNSWSSTGSMASTRALASQFLLPNGTVLVAGGMTGDITQGGLATGACEIYNPTTGSWSSAPAFPNQHKVAGAASLRLQDGRYAVIGGGNNTLYWPHGNTVSYAYDATNNKWTTMPAMQAGRLAPVVLELQACGLAMFGGGTTNSATAVSTYELFVK